MADAIPTSEKIAVLEQRLRAKFALAEAKLTTSPTPQRPAPNASPGDLLVLMSKNSAIPDPEDTVKAWGEEFRGDVDRLLSELDRMAAEGAMWSAVVKFLRDKITSLPADTPPEIVASVATLKAATDGSALTCARRIELIIDDQIAELARVKAIWGSRSSIACDIVIAKRSAEFLHRAGRHEAARPYEIKHTAMAQKRAELQRRGRRERNTGDE